MFTGFALGSQHYQSIVECVAVAKHSSWVLHSLRPCSFRELTFSPVPDVCVSAVGTFQLTETEQVDVCI